MSRRALEKGPQEALQVHDNKIAAGVVQKIVAVVCGSLSRTVNNCALYKNCCAAPGQSRHTDELMSGKNMLLGGEGGERSRA